MSEPSVAFIPLIMAKRMEGSSYQAIADNFNDGGVVGDTFGVASTVFLALPGTASAFSGIRVFFSSVEVTGVLVSTES
jgi:hypothetical protein